MRISLARVTLVLVVAGCGSTAASAREDPDPPPIETSDTCTSLPPECVVGHESDDGCPDPGVLSIGFARGSAALDDDSQRQLEWLSADGRHLHTGVVIHLVPELAPGEPDELAARRTLAIRDALVARGVPVAVLTVDDARPLDLEGEDPDASRVVVETSGCPAQSF